MIQPYDLLTALDLYSLMLFFWFTLLFDLPRYLLSAIAMACVPWHSPPPKRCSTSAVVHGNRAHEVARQVEQQREPEEKHQAIQVERCQQIVGLDHVRSVLSDCLRDCPIRLDQEQRRVTSENYRSMA